MDTDFRWYFTILLISVKHFIIDLNALPVSGLEKNIGVIKGDFKPDTENSNDMLERRTNKIGVSVSPDPVKETDTSPDCTVNALIEVEYIESENLPDLSCVDKSFSALLSRLDSKEWILVCEALNNVRQLSLYHNKKLLEIIEYVIPLIVKSLKNPRSAVCKTAIMTCAEIFKIYRDSVIDLLDTMLPQLFLKSSQDKRFVCEAAETALIAMTTWVSPYLLLQKLLSYLKHKNPRIRAKTSMCFSKSVSQLGVQGIKEYGIDKLLQIAATQLSDQLPESRESARTLILELQTRFQESQASYENEKNSEISIDNSWDAFCHSKLSPLNANVVLRVTSAHKESC